jgi:hypothetical protein
MITAKTKHNKSLMLNNNKVLVNVRLASKQD